MSTPTLEKAAAVIEKLERDGYRFLDDLSGYDESTLISYIAAAIREAENETLENAALWCDGEAKTPSSAGAKAAGRREAGRRLGRVLRHIKHKD